MANYTIKLTNNITTLTDTTIKSGSNGFLFKYNCSYYIISVHHFLPISESFLDSTSEIIKLKKFKNINWNELMIFEKPNEKYLLNTKIVKNYKTRFVEPQTKIIMEINNIIESYETVNYEIICSNPLSKLRSIYLKFIIGKCNDSERINYLNKYQGLSGKPIFDINGKLLGVFCKITFVSNPIITEEGTIYNIYGLILPSIYIIKSIQKKDNESIYMVDIDDYDVKIGKFEIQREINKDSSTFNYGIYYLPINFKIPLDIYFVLNGDDDLKIMSKNIKTSILKNIKFIKNENFDFNLIIEKNKDGFFKLNNGLITSLTNYNKEKAIKTIATFYKYDKPINNIWIKI
jgi:hypothetical protein